MSVSLVVLAAGIGSRYGGLKQLDAVGPSGEPLLHYSLFDAVRSGFDKIVFVVRADVRDALQQGLGPELKKAVAVEYVLQDIPEGRKKPWGTAHAVMLCRDVVQEPFGVINADDFYGRESFGVLSGFLRSASMEDLLYCMVSFTLRKTLSAHGQVARGICEIDGDGLLKGVTECVGLERDGDGARLAVDGGTIRRFSGDERVSMNMWGFSPAIFDQCQRVFAEFEATNEDSADREFYIPTVVDRLIGEGVVRVKALATTGEWFGITYREDKDAVMAEIRKLVELGEYPASIGF
jgi:NDP-sugar pyrophosphorylase family protein